MVQALALRAVSKAYRSTAAALRRISAATSVAAEILALGAMAADAAEKSAAATSEEEVREAVAQWLEAVESSTAFH